MIGKREEDIGDQEWEEEEDKKMLTLAHDAGSSHLRRRGYETCRL